MQQTIREVTLFVRCCIWVKGPNRYSPALLCMAACSLRPPSTAYLVSAPQQEQVFTDCRQKLLCRSALSLRSASSRGRFQQVGSISETKFMSIMENVGMYNRAQSMPCNAQLLQFERQISSRSFQVSFSLMSQMKTILFASIFLLILVNDDWSTECRRTLLALPPASRLL